MVNIRTAVGTRYRTVLFSPIFIDLQIVPLQNLTSLLSKEFRFNLEFFPNIFRILSYNGRSEIIMVDPDPAFNSGSDEIRTVSATLHWDAVILAT